MASSFDTIIYQEEQRTMSMEEQASILDIDDLTIRYSTGNGDLTAVSNASFTIEQGDYFGLVGESGCGKSTIAKSIMGGLDHNGRIVSGTIRYKGKEIQNFSESELNEEIRWNEISWIPQGAMSSLDPLERVSDQAAEIAEVHTNLSRKDAVAKLRNLFNVVGLSPDRVSDYPHQFSGGMQQRALIALALFLEPSLLIADEPTTALDVIMQDQVFKYLDKIKEETNVGMLLITHDISLVFESCDEVAVMHSGQIAETGTTHEVYNKPHHPYTILLQEAFPDIRYPDRELESIQGNPPQNLGSVEYCTFVERCPWAVKECSEFAPQLENLNDRSNKEDSVGGSHKVACFRKDEVLKEYRMNKGNSKGDSKR